MSTTIKLTYTSITSHSSFLFWWWKHLRSTLRKFQVYNSVLLTVHSHYDVHSSYKRKFVPFDQHLICTIFPSPFWMNRSCVMYSQNVPGNFPITKPYLCWKFGCLVILTSILQTSSTALSFSTYFPPYFGLKANQWG